MAEPHLCNPEPWPGCRVCLTEAVQSRGLPAAERRRALQADACLLRLEAVYQIPVRYRARNHRTTRAA